MQPQIDHIQITVKNLNEAELFYDRFLPLLGFDPNRKVKAHIAEHDFDVVEYTHPKLAFAITSPRLAFANDDVNRRKPGSLHHLAFKAESRAQVDQLYGELKKMEAMIVTPPRLYPEYSPDYYAVFLKDPDGIKFELVCTKAE
ncbi:VOC family protein [Mangrovibacterium lignilyticum]|uniref:VOC family protein n=1 Tax=Mangrovibacterium lignilyticum TaxID=2668052 RepID=UPI0013D2B51B|nr:VOC family protein [Mangrovibacterium lignilyticum]